MKLLMRWDNGETFAKGITSKNIQCDNEGICLFGTREEVRESLAALKILFISALAFEASYEK